MFATYATYVSAYATYAIAHAFNVLSCKRVLSQTCNVHVFTSSSKYD